MPEPLTAQAHPAHAASQLAGLQPALRWLDGLLERAVAATQSTYGPEASADPFRGLYISRGEAEQLLARDGATPLTAANGDAADDPWPDILSGTSRLAWLARAFDLSPFDARVVTIALAPALDLRYERLYAYLQDDVTLKWPTVSLALNLLCPSPEARMARRASFAPDAPLVRPGLIHLVSDGNALVPTLLSQAIRLDEQIVNALLGQPGLDPRLWPLCETEYGIPNAEYGGAEAVAPGIPYSVFDIPPEMRALPALVREARERRRPLRLYFQGPPGAGRRRTAVALAREIGAPLLVLALPPALAAEGDFAQTLRLALRHAWFQDAILYLDGLDALRAEDRAAAFQQLHAALREDRGITILAGTKRWESAPASLGGAVETFFHNVITVLFVLPDFAQREAAWRAHLAAAGLELAPEDAASLADRYRLNLNQIADAVTAARGAVRWREAGLALDGSESGVRSPESGANHTTDSGLRTPDSPHITLRDLYAAARAQSGQELAALARKIEPVYTWDHIVLPVEALAQLRELCRRVLHRHRVLEQWGFGRRLSMGKGINCLFAGPSGTGKTMAAEIIARELGLDLYKIDLSGVVSKYIGETEKNLDHTFTAAESANAILFFDEADALFGKRSEVRDSHDRYANIEISYLLQRMEQYDGITILATNLRGNLDEAFLRRLAFTVHFPAPDEAHRRRIWGGIWPPELPLAADVDLDFLARQFKLSGGNIKNIALAAAFLAAEDGGGVTMAHLLQATRREYLKMGKALTSQESGVRGP